MKRLQPLALSAALLKRSPNNGRALFGLAESLRARDKADAADAVKRQFKRIRADVTITSSGF